MASFTEVGAEAKQRLVKVSKGFQQRQTYRDNLGRLVGESRLIEIIPDEGESLRKLKVNARRAANEMNVDIAYGDTAQGTLLVWKEQARERRPGRGRPRKNADGE
jgi:hypothetical protein